jgi:general nucleoside transport system permease protein
METPPMLETFFSSIFSASYLAAILRVATPIILPSLGALLSEKAGVVNIGLEGMTLAAAFSGATVGALSGSLWLGVGIGLLSGVLMALLLAFFHLGLGGNLILGGVAVNILGSAGTIAIGYQISGGRSGGGVGGVAVTIPAIDLPFLNGIPLVGETLYAVFGNQNLMTWLALLSVGATAFLFYRTPFGLHLRAVGENSAAAASVGIRVRRTQYIALALSGFLAAMGGLHLSMGYLSGFTRDMTAGRGYIALVTPALGGGTPLGTGAAAMLFATFAALETRLGGLALPSQLPQMIPYAAAIVALVLAAWRKKAAQRRAASAVVIATPVEAKS